MPITWLASYPKSGNTWLRFLLANILLGRAPSSSLEVSRRIPDIHRPDVPADPPGPEGREFIKTHFMRAPAHPRLGETGRVIHVVRHPRDVLLSALNYRRMEGVIDTLTDAQYAQSFIAASGDGLWARLGYGSWLQHTASWLEPGVPALLVLYERLKADPAAELRRILAFLEIDAGEEAIARAVKESSFDNLRALEIRERAAKGKSIFPGRPADTKAGRFFFNKGGTGQRLDPIAPGLDAAFEQRFGPALRNLGYE
jgi:hypothetical protein